METNLSADYALLVGTGLAGVGGAEGGGEGGLVAVRIYG